MSLPALLHFTDDPPAITHVCIREAQLLILDEPTAAIDARAEVEVFSALKELSHGVSIGRTVIGPELI